MNCPGFYDWGMVMRRTGMWDIAYVLCNGLPPEAAARPRARVDRSVP